MLLNLSDVLSDLHKPIKESMGIEIKDYRGPSGKVDLISIEPLKLSISHIKARQLSIVGQVKFETTLPCDRCLEPVKQVIDLDFEKKVDLSLASDEQNEDFDESNYIDGYTLDVDLLIRNEILIGWPTKILCSDDCKGICSTCGQNLNHGSCDCEDTSLDPRMSVIRDVFKNFKEV